MAEKILDHIQSLSATDADLKELLAFLNKSDKTLGRDPRNVDALLGHIDPAIYSLAFSYLLSYKTTLEIPDHHLFAQQAIALLTRADPKQIKFNASYFVTVCFNLVRSCGFLNRHASAIRPLYSAIQLLQQGKPNTLTAVHSQFVYACLKAKCYDLAAPVLDQPVFSIQPDFDSLSPEDYLSYFYYGGMVYIGLKQFDKALDFFQVALTTPSTALSAIQIRAYQKMVLVGLITNGELVDLPPRITSHIVLRNVDKLCGMYTKFANAFLKGVPQATKFLDENKDAFKKENNFGLAKQTLAASVRRQIKRLTSTYVSLPLNDLAQRAGLASAQQAEVYVRRMVEEGQILARINQQAGVVSFQETPEQYNSSAAVALLDNKIKEASRLTELVRQADKAIQVHPNYVQKVLRAANEKAGGPPGPGRGMLGDMDDDPELAAALRASMQS